MTSRIDVCALYPELRDGASPSLYDYTPIIEAIGDVVVRVDQQDYEGDTWALLRRGDEWGYLLLRLGLVFGLRRAAGGELRRRGAGARR